MASFLEKLQVETQFYNLVSDHPAFSDFYIEKVLKTGPDQVTAIAIFNGEKVVMKRSLEAEAGRKVLEAKQELDTLAAVMTVPPYRINECIAVFPELGIIVLSFVPGLRLDFVIKEADVPKRATLMQLSGGWLKTYTMNRSEVTPKFSPDWWIKKRVEAFGSGQPKEIQELFDSVLHHLRDVAPSLRGKDITKAAVHADYVSINAHYHDGSIYGVDVQGKARFPIVQDVAKFLVWTQTQTPLEPPLAPTGMRYIHGIAEPDFSAFLASDVLPTEEVRTFLPFFVGLQVLGCIRAFQNDKLAMSRVRQMVERFILPT